MKLPKILVFSVSTLLLFVALYYQFGLDWEGKGAVRNTVFSDEWPYSTVLIDHVVENLTEFDELADLVEEKSDDFAVALTPGTDSGLCAIREKYTVCTEYSDPRILSLLTDLSISAIGRMDGNGVEVVVNEQCRNDTRLTTLLIRDKKLFADTEACTDRMSFAGTGKCAITAPQLWGILYYWFPMEYC